MRLQTHDVDIHLKKGLSPLYFVFGEEPFQQQDVIQAIRNTAKEQGYQERECFDVTGPQFDWDNFQAKLKTRSLFSQKRLIECHLKAGKIGKTGAAVLTSLASHATANHSTAGHSPPDTLFLFSADKLEPAAYKSTWFAALERFGITFFARTLNYGAFVNWLKQRLLKENLTLSEEAFYTLVERTEGNLLAAAHTIEKLTLLEPLPPLSLPTPPTPITRETIINMIGNHTRFSVFDLVEATFGGTLLRTKQIFHSLKDEGIEPILVLWALTREVRAIIPIARSLVKGISLSQGLREYNVLKHKITVFTAFLNRNSPSSSLTLLYQTLLKAKMIDDIIKGAHPGEVWTELFSLCCSLFSINVKGGVAHA